MNKIHTQDNLFIIKEQKKYRLSSFHDEYKGFYINQYIKISHQSIINKKYVYNNYFINTITNTSLQ